MRPAFIGVLRRIHFRLRHRIAMWRMDRKFPLPRELQRPPF